MANQVYDLLSSVRRWGQGSGCTCPHRIEWTSLIDESFLFGREFSSGKRRTARMRGESSTVWGVSAWWNVRLMNGLPTISDEMDQRCCFPVWTQLITELLADFSLTWFLFFPLHTTWRTSNVSAEDFLGRSDLFPRILFFPAVSSAAVSVETAGALRIYHSKFLSQ